MSKYRLTVLLLSIVLYTTVYAQEVVFDFSSVGEDQSGEYQTSQNARLIDGKGVLKIGEDWIDIGFPYRIGFVIDWGGVNIEQYPIMLDLSFAPLSFWQNLNFLSPYILADRNSPIEHWILGVYSLSHKGRIWIKAKDIMPGESRYYFYWGGDRELELNIPVSPFIYSFPIDGYIILSDIAPQGELIIYSYTDNNSIVLPDGSTIQLNRGESYTVPNGSFSQGSIIEATAPIAGYFNINNTDSLPPIGLSSTVLASPIPRGNIDPDSFFIYSPVGDSQVTVYINGELSVSFQVSQGEIYRYDANIPDNGSIIIESSSPIVVEHYGIYNSSRGFDTFALVYPSERIIGAATGETVVMAVEDNTNIEVYYSDRSSDSFVLNRGETYKLRSGNQGVGPGILIIADKPIAGVSYADGDSGEAIPFLPTELLSPLHIIPAQFEYMVIVTEFTDTECELKDSSGNLLSRYELGAVPSPYPEKIRITGIDELGVILECNYPVYVMYEERSFDQETISWPVTLFRPVLSNADYSVSWDDEVETVYPTSYEYIITPVATINRFISWKGVTIQSEIPQDCEIGYQISKGDGSWLYFNGERWVGTDNIEQFNGEEELIEAISLYSEDRIQFRVILHSFDGRDTPVIDEIRLSYDAVGEPEKIIFDRIDREQVSGVSFQIRITVYDINDRVVEDFNAQGRLSTNIGLEVEPTQITFHNGIAEQEVRVFGIGENVTLRVAIDQYQLSGESNPFKVVSAKADRLEKVSGDEQFAPAGTTLPKPIVVRTVNSKGEPIGGVRVEFYVIEGDGYVSPEVTYSDERGLASTNWTLGPEPGPNRLEVIADGVDDSLIFVARGEGEGGSRKEGGCSCSVGSSSNLDLLFILELLLKLL